MLLPTAKTNWLAPGPENFTRRAGKLLDLMRDNASEHMVKWLEVPPKVVSHPLPSRTLEPQPAEPVWPLVREAVANEVIAELGAWSRCRSSAVDDGSTIPRSSAGRSASSARQPSMVSLPDASV
jgi:hypothetical protein